MALNELILAAVVRIGTNPKVFRPCPGTEEVFEFVEALRAPKGVHVRAEVLASDRLNAFVISGFAGVALLIALVGVAGVLAFSVSARTREFAVRLAIGSTPRQLLARVLREGALIEGIGIIAGAAGGYAFAGVAGSIVEGVRLPGVLLLLGTASVLAAGGVLASLTPAARASYVDVMQALRLE